MSKVRLRYTEFFLVVNLKQKKGMLMLNIF